MAVVLGAVAVASVIGACSSDDAEDDNLESTGQEALRRARDEGLTAAYLGTERFKAGGEEFSLTASEYPTTIAGVDVDAVKVTYGGTRGSDEMNLYTLARADYMTLIDELPSARDTHVAVTTLDVFGEATEFVTVPEPAPVAGTWVVVDNRRHGQVSGWEEGIVIVQTTGAVWTPPRIEAIMRNAMRGYDSFIDRGLEDIYDQDVASAANLGKAVGVTTYWIGPDASVEDHHSDTLTGEFFSADDRSPASVSVRYASLRDLSPEFTIRSFPVHARTYVQQSFSVVLPDPRFEPALRVAGHPARVSRADVRPSGVPRGMLVFVEFDDAIVVASTSNLIGSGGEELNLLLLNPDSFIELLQKLRPYPEQGDGTHAPPPLKSNSR
jgi:hypothetical protein